MKNITFLFVISCICYSCLSSEIKEFSMNTVRVGVGVIIYRDGHILLGKRKNAHGDGCWSPPGGHLEMGETLIDCAKREVLEETGLEIVNPSFLACTNDIFSSEKHYLTVFMIGRAQGMAENREPHKCEGWQWFPITELPDPLFLPLSNLIQAHGLYFLTEYKK